MAGLGVIQRFEFGVLYRLLGAVFLLSVPAQLEAADMFWSVGRGDGSGGFSTANNWAGGDVPGLFDVAHFGMTTSALFPKTYTVTFTNHPDNQQLIVEDDRVTFDLNGHTYRVRNNTVAMRLGTESGRSGGLTITEGTVAAPFQSNILIGNFGVGFLTVTTGGLLIGAPDIFLNGGGDTLTVSGGGDIIADRFFNDGTATITGNGSALVATLMDGIGTLNVTAGGAVETTSAILGRNFSGHAMLTVDGPGSRWINSGSLTLGANGLGTLRITDGGRVSTTAAVIASPNDFGSLVTVAGADSTWAINGRLGVGGDPATGSNGFGIVSIRPGGTVNVVQDTQIFSDDLLLLDGGTLSTTEISFPTSEVSITPGTFRWTSGTLHVGIFRGDLTVPDGGVFAPGISLGTSIVFGDYTETPGGKLQIEIGGSPASFQFDVLEVHGDAVLGGNLELSLLNGFVPTAANGYAVLTPTGSLSGTFTNVASGQRLKTSDGGGSFVVSYGAGSPFNPTFVVLSAYQSLLPGDYNFDNIVDAADYTTWRNTLGQTGVALPGDGNNDGTVDSGDYNLWRARFGQTAAAGATGSASAGVPEPVSFILLCVGTLSLLVMRRADYSDRLP